MLLVLCHLAAYIIDHTTVPGSQFSVKAQHTLLVQVASTGHLPGLLGCAGISRLQQDSGAAEPVRLPQ